MNTPRIIFIIWLLLLSGCSCSSEVLCPESFAVGGACEVEGQQCVYPESLCGTPCRCVNQPGGFVWECATQYCKCTCDCGRYAIASCELLECTEEDDPCVAQALPLCEMVCTDDGGVDGPRDAGADTGGDAGVREAGAEAGADAGPDSSPPRDASPDQPRDTSPDQAVDMSPDLARDASPDQLADTGGAGGDQSTDSAAQPG